MNKARNTFFEQEATEGDKRVRKNEDNFRVTCKICGRPTRFSSNQEDWNSKVKPILYSAFIDWIHVSYESKKNWLSCEYPQKEYGLKYSL